MKANVKQDKCIGCGNCVALTESQVFDFNDEGLAECILEEIPSDLEEITKPLNNVQLKLLKKSKKSSYFLLYLHIFLILQVSHIGLLALQ